MDKFSSPEYKRSRKAVITESAVDYLAMLLVADAYIAKLLSSIGISDSLVGIISSFVTLAFIIELASIFIARKKVGAKKVVTICCTASMLCFTVLYLIPFIPAGKGIKTALTIICFLLAYGFKYIISSIRFKWTNSFVSPTGRGVFAATNEIVSLALGMIFTAVVGYAVDKFIRFDNLSGAFIFIATAMTVLNIGNIICFLLIKKDEPEEDRKKAVPMSEIYANTLKKTGFIKILVLTILYNVAIYFSMGFIGIYKTKNLMMSMFSIQLINIIASLARIAVSPAIGRYTDKRTYEKGMMLGLYFAAIAYFVNIFTTSDSWYLIIVFTILQNCSHAGLAANSTNILYAHVDIKYLTYAVALKNCISGIMGFIASIAGGLLLEAIQSKNNCIFGVQIYGQQILSSITFILLIATIIFLDRALIRPRERKN